jgi:hypothetical protein
MRFRPQMRCIQSASVKYAYAAVGIRVLVRR